MDRTDQPNQEQMLKQLVEVLRNRFRWVDGYSKPSPQEVSARLVSIPEGIIQFYGMMLVEQATEEIDGAYGTVPKPHSYYVMGSLRPGATAATLGQFTDLLRKTARMLGASSEQIIESSSADQFVDGRKIHIPPGYVTSAPVVITLRWPA